MNGALEVRLNDAYFGLVSTTKLFVLKGNIQACSINTYDVKTTKFKWLLYDDRPHQGILG